MWRTVSSGYRLATEQERLEQIAVDTAQRASDIARAQVLAGTSDIVTALQAQQTLFSDLDILAQVRLDAVPVAGGHLQGTRRRVFRPGCHPLRQAPSSTACYEQRRSSRVCDEQHFFTGVP